MKQLLTLILVYFFSITFCQGQQPTANDSTKKYEATIIPVDSITEKVKYTEVIQVPNLSKEQLWNNLMRWFSLNFNSAESVIDLEDKDSGKIIGKGFSKISIKTALGTSPLKMKFMIEVDVKDGKYRYSITNISYENYPVHPYPLRTWTAEEYITDEALKNNPKSSKDIQKHREATTEVINSLILSLHSEMIQKEDSTDDW